MANMSATPVRVCLWVVPRSISTAFCRCIGEIPECEVWFEPIELCAFAAQFLQYEDGEQLPREYAGNEDVFFRAAAILETKYGISFPPQRLAMADVVQSVESSTAKYTFIKDMAHYTIEPESRDQNSTFCIPEGFRHAFLIREPTLVFESLRKLRFLRLSKAQLLPNDVDEHNFDMMTHEPAIPTDRFYEKHHALWQHIRSTVEPDPIVIDAADLLAKPAEVIPKFCEAVGLPYNESMLEWGSDVESARNWRWPSDDFINDKNCFGAAMASGNFKTSSKEPLSRDQLSEGVLPLTDKAMPYYQEMYENRLRV